MSEKAIEEIRKKTKAKTQESEQLAEQGEEAPILKKEKELATKKEKGGGKKTECAISRAGFEEGAKHIKLMVDDKPVIAEVKTFSSGSFGWFCNEKVTVEVDGVPVRVQCNFNLVVVGSKDAK